MPGSCELDLLAHGQSAVNEGSGDHGAEAGDGEAAVDGEAGTAQVLPGVGLIQDAVHGFFQFVQAIAGVGGDADHGAALEGCAFQGVFNLGFDQFHQFFIDQISLGDHHQAAGDLQDIEDSQMLPGLRHDAFIGGHDQQCEVDGAHAGQHVFDKSLVAGNVDDADFPSAGQFHPGETQVNGHFPGFLFGEAVRIDAGQRFNQGGFAVVHMSGGAYYVHISVIAKQLIRVFPDWLSSYPRIFGERTSKWSTRKKPRRS